MSPATMMLHPSSRLPLVRRSGLLFSWDVADVIDRYTLDARTGQAGVFTRAGATGVFHDAALLPWNAVHSLPRVAAFYNSATGLYEPAVQLEQAAKNVVLRSEDLNNAAWTKTGGPTVTSAVGQRGAVVIDLVSDSGAGTLEWIEQAVTFTGDGKKSIGVYIARGTSTSTVIALKDSTSSANRLLAAITWSNGLPVITMTTGASLGYMTIADGVFLIWLQSTTVTAAHTNVVQLFPATTAGLATANTGDVYLGGIHASDDAAPGSYPKTTSAAVTKTADALSWAINFVRQSLTAYVRCFQVSAGYGVGTGRSLLRIGTTLAGNTPSMAIAEASNSDGSLLGQHHNGSVDSRSTPAFQDLPGDLIEARLAVDAAGAATLGVAINGGAEIVGAAGSVSALSSNWETNIVTVSNCGLSRIRILPGVQSLDAMRNLQ